MGRPMIVLTQNIWGGAPFWKARRRPLARLLGRLRPDVVALQEVHAPLNDLEPGQASELAGLVGGYQAVFARGRSPPRGPPRASRSSPATRSSSPRSTR